MSELVEVFWYIVRNVMLLALLMLSGGVVALFTFIAYLWWREGK